MKSAVRIFSRKASLARALLIAVAVSGAGIYNTGAQQVTDFARSGTYVIDGSTPVDARTRELVDTYMAQRRTRELEEAERRARIKLFEYHANSTLDQQFGRF